MDSIQVLPRLADNWSPPRKETAMGVRADERGVTLIFHDKLGNPTGEVVNGEFAFFFSRRRPVDPTGTNAAHGYPDWLSDLFVFDNPIKLRGLTPTQSGIQLTSAASQQVLLHWDTADGSKTIPQQVTISSSSSNKPKVNNRFYCDTVKVMPGDAVLNSSNKLWNEWVVASQSILLQAQTPAGAATAAQKGGTPPSKKKP
jgi:hypothetical protein